MLITSYLKGVGKRIKKKLLYTPKKDFLYKKLKWEALQNTSVYLWKKKQKVKKIQK